MNIPLIAPGIRCLVLGVFRNAQPPLPGTDATKYNGTVCLAMRQWSHNEQARHLMIPGEYWVCSMHDEALWIIHRQFLIPLPPDEQAKGMFGGVRSSPREEWA